MKVLIFLLLVLPFNITDEPVTEDCKCKGILLYGKVRVVDAFEDLDVDTNVRVPSKCGEWRFVDAFEDFTIKYVDAFEDFNIKYVDAFPGKP